MFHKESVQVGYVVIALAGPSIRVPPSELLLCFGAADLHTLRFLPALIQVPAEQHDDNSSVHFHFMCLTEGLTQRKEKKNVDIKWIILCCLLTYFTTRCQLYIIFCKSNSYEPIQRSIERTTVFTQRSLHNFA